MRAVFVMVLGSCLSCGTLRSTRVKSSVTLDDHLIGLQVAQARIFFHCCWCSPSALASSLIVVRDAARVILPVGVPARNLHEGGDQYDVSLGGEGEGGGAGLEADGNQCFAA